MARLVRPSCVGQSAPTPRAARWVAWTPERPRTALGGRTGSVTRIPCRSAFPVSSLYGLSAVSPCAASLADLTVRRWNRAGGGDPKGQYVCQPIPKEAYTTPPKLMVATTGMSVGPVALVYCS